MSYVKDHIKESLKDHELTLLEEGKHFKLYRMHKPDRGNCMSVNIAFSRGYILIFGDLTPSRPGNMSVVGYNETWFAGKLGESYLCEKFLETKWVREYAEKWMRGEEFFEYLLESYSPPKVLEKFKFIQDTLKNVEKPSEEEQEENRKKEVREKLDDILNYLDDYGPEKLYEELTDLGYDCSDGVPGWGYDPAEAGWLCGIQQRFSELHQKFD